MWKYILLFMVSCLTTDTMQSQTYYSEFIQNLDSMKNTGLRRTKKDNSEDYYIPEEAVKNYIKLFNQLQCTRKNATVQCFYKCDLMTALSSKKTEVHTAKASTNDEKLL